MSFYTSLTGLNSATAQLGVTSNNIANVGTTGFKRSRADFGDIFATSPLQKASSTVGQGVSLKQVSQEFSQGNISFSSNALDLAITGDGFFPLKSADGLQDIFTRNGAFMLNEQFNVVNSAGQRLMAATVDSTGSANVNERVVLTIPQKTSGDADITKFIELGVNFPADAEVIDPKVNPFNRSNPASYNKSTAMTVYDAGGNGYLATIYYAKTRNASQASPTNKWQTYVFVGEEQLTASLQQATDENGEPRFVNMYGETKPLSAVKESIVNTKTKMFALDDLTNTQVSKAAALRGTAVVDLVPTDVSTTAINLAAGVDFSTFSAADKAALKNLFTVDVDGSGSPVSVDLSYLVNRSSFNNLYTGDQIATEITNVLNRKFGGERYFEFSSADSRQFTVSLPSTTAAPVAPATTGVTTTRTATIGLTPDVNGRLSMDQMVDQINAAFLAASLAPTSASGSTPANAFPATVSVVYDPISQGLVFKDSGSAAVSVSASPANIVLGIPTTATPLTDGLLAVKPNTEIPIRRGDPVPPSELPSLQRYGIKVTFDPVGKTFLIASGSTGDKSSLNISGITAGSLATQLLGLTNDKQDVALEAERGLKSKPAMAIGSTFSTNISTNFSVDPGSEEFIVTVDDVRGTVKIPVRSNYSLASFITELENGINKLTDSTGKTVNGVKVSYDPAEKVFKFTTGTASTNSFIKVSGSSAWGLSETESVRGATSTWIKPTQFVDGTGKPVYIDEFGKETTAPEGLKSAEWSPLYLDKGELTFDTGGKILSPAAGVKLEKFFLAGGKGALEIKIDYSKSTQFTSPFAVLSQSQDGAPEGDLVGVTIGVDGLVSASYSNGAQKSLAKILLVNFSSPKGLRQIGDSSFLSSAASGNPILGTAGGAGFG
ncbi:MAG: Flagellar hook protein FlgE, partial [Pseudomonadota bacterium]